MIVLMRVIAGLFLLGLWHIASAEVVIWQATGTLTVVDTTDGLITEFPSAEIDSAFALTFAFETSSPVSTINTESDFGGGVWLGDRYRYFDALVMVELSIGDADLSRTAEGTEFIDIWDNFASVGTSSESCVDTATIVCDGFVMAQGLASSQEGGFAQIALTIRGPEHLDLFSGPGLPTTPPPLLTTLSTRSFQFCDSASSAGDCIIGTVDNMTVVAEDNCSDCSSSNLLKLILQLRKEDR